MGPGIKSDLNSKLIFFINTPVNVLNTKKLLFSLLQYALPTEEYLSFSRQSIPQIFGNKCMKYNKLEDILKPVSLSVKLIPDLL